MKAGRIILIIILLAFAVFVFFKLKGNKEEVNRLTELAEASVDAFPVRVETINRSDFESSIRLSGRLSARDEVMLTSALNGRVGSILVEAGQEVKKGQVLMTLEDDLIRSEVSIAKAAYEQAKSDLDKFTRLKEGDAVTGQQLELLQLKAESTKTQYQGAQKKLDETRIKSPIDGVVHQVLTKVGSLCGPSVPVCEIVNIEDLILKLNGGETLAASVEKGDSVSIKIPVKSLSDVPGIITYVGVKPGYTGLFPIEIEVHNSEELKAGYLANVNFSKRLNDQIVVPKASVYGTNQNRYVYIIENDLAAQTPVVTGIEDGSSVTVLEGLDEGQLLVIEGANRLSDGSSVKIIE